MAELQRKLTPVDWLILVLCVVGVVMAFVLAFNHSQIYLWSAHATEVNIDSWNSTATIGLFVALGVASLISLFVWFLAKSTLGSDPAEDD